MLPHPPSCPGWRGKPSFSQAPWTCSAAGVDSGQAAAQALEDSALGTSGCLWQRSGQQQQEPKRHSSREGPCNSCFLTNPQNIGSLSGSRRQVRGEGCERNPNGPDSGHELHENFSQPFQGNSQIRIYLGWRDLFPKLRAGLAPRQCRGEVCNQKNKPEGNQIPASLSPGYLSPTEEGDW